MSEEQVACVLVHKPEVNIFDTSSGEVVSTMKIYGRVLACNSKCQLVTSGSNSIVLSDGNSSLWKRIWVDSTACLIQGMFSPKGQFVICWKSPSGPMKVLDTLSGNILCSLHAGSAPDRYCTFVSDEECVVNYSCFPNNFGLKLFNVKSGNLLNVIEFELETRVSCLAALPCKRLVAIGLVNASPNFKVIRVCLPGDKDNRKSKR